MPAHMDGHAPGLERVQDLGIGAVTFPASGNAEDLALLLADTHGADLVVTVGFQATLHEFLDRGRSGSNPSTFLTRLKLGSKVVDGKAVATLHRSRVSVGAVVLLVARRARRGGRRPRGLRRRRRLRRLDGQHLAHRHELDRGRLLVISLRYHIISIAAVFLALAVGVVLGSTTLSALAAFGPEQRERGPRRAGQQPAEREERPGRARSPTPTASPRRSARWPCRGSSRSAPSCSSPPPTRARRPGRAQDPRRERGGHGHRRAAADRRRSATRARPTSSRTSSCGCCRPVSSCPPRPTPARSPAVCSGRSC